MKKLIVGLVAGCILLAGCGGAASKESAQADSGRAYSDAAVAEEAMYDDYAESTYEDADYSNEATAMNGSAVAEGVTFAKDRKIVYQSNVILETKTYSDTYKHLITLIDKYRGYIEYESFDNQKRSYLYDDRHVGNVVIATNNMTIRIPSESYSAFMKEGLDLGNVLSRNQTIEDRTNEYNTNKSYVDILNDEDEYLGKQLKVLENELKAAQANDKHYDEIIENMKDIAERKAQVEKELVPYKSAMDEIDEKVEYSTITMELREVNEFTVIEEPVEDEPTFVMQLKETWNNAMKSLSNLLKGTLLFLIRILPAIIYIAILGAVVLLIVLAVKKVAKNTSFIAYKEEHKAKKMKAYEEKKAKEAAKKAAKKEAMIAAKNEKMSDSNSSNESK